MTCEAHTKERLPTALDRCWTHLIYAMAKFLSLLVQHLAIFYFCPFFRYLYVRRHQRHGVGGVRSLHHCRQGGALKVFFANLFSRFPTKN